MRAGTAKIRAAHEGLMAIKPPRTNSDQKADRRLPCAGQSFAPQISIDEKVAFLSDPANYPELPSHVDVIETHRSWVFLTDDHAYKCKKPVRLSFLDFSTLDNRLENCRTEVRLNRRLAPDTYLGVVALVCICNDKLALEDEAKGEPVEWLVKMRRLPNNHMLDQALQTGKVGSADVQPFADLLARFYNQAKSLDVNPAKWRAATDKELRANRQALAKTRFHLSSEQVHSIADRLSRFLQSHGGLLEDRVRDGRIIEGHGDLRPEHIYIGDPPAIIDCLEFNRELRILDPADELAYLALECELLGAPFVGETVFNTYRNVTRDQPDPHLVDFYKCHRAMLRAKLCVWHLLDEDTGEHSEWVHRAEDYLAAAEDHSRALPVNHA